MPVGSPCRPALRPRPSTLGRRANKAVRPSARPLPAHSPPTSEASGRRGDSHPGAAVRPPRVIGPSISVRASSSSNKGAVAQSAAGSLHGCRRDVQLAAPLQEAAMDAARGRGRGRCSSSRWASRHGPDSPCCHYKFMSLAGPGKYCQLSTQTESPSQPPERCSARRGAEVAVGPGRGGRRDAQAPQGRGYSAALVAATRSLAIKLTRLAAPRSRRKGASSPTSPWPNATQRTQR